MTEATDRDKEDTAKKDVKENIGSSRSTLPLFALPCVLAVLSGALLHYSYFFGGSLVLVFISSVIYAIYRIAAEEKLKFKTLEVYLVALCIPLLAALSAISALPEISGFAHLPMAPIVLNMMLISIVGMHLALWCRTCGRLNQCIVLGYSFTLIVASVIGTGYIWGRWGWKPQIGFLPSWVPTCLVFIYALAPFTESTFRLREKLSISAMESGALLASFLGFAGCITAYYQLPALLPGLILATVLCSMLYADLDFLEHQMRLPQEQWTEATETRSVCHVAIKVLPLLTIVLWAGMGAFGSWAMREDELERIAAVASCYTPPYQCRGYKQIIGFVSLFAVLIGGMHGFLFITIQELREQEPPLLKFNRKSSYGFVAVGAIMLLKLAIACYYLICPHATVPAWVAMTIVGSLYLLLTFLLYSIRAALHRYNITLLLISIGLGIYLLATGAYLHNTHTDDDAPPFLAVFLTGFVVCSLLVIHFSVAIAEQEDKKTTIKQNPAGVMQSGVIATTENV